MDKSKEEMTRRSHGVWQGTLMSFGIQVKVVTRGKFTSSMHEFLNVIIELNLVDLQLEKEI